MDIQTDNLRDLMAEEPRITQPALALRIKGLEGTTQAKQHVTKQRVNQMLIEYDRGVLLERDEKRIRRAIERIRKAQKR